MTKVISLSDDAYEKLKGMKEEGESFSMVVRRLGVKKETSRLLKFSGIVKNQSFLDALDDVVKSRKSLKFRTPRL